MTTPTTPNALRTLTWTNLAAQSAEQISLAAVPIVAVLALNAGPGEIGLLNTAQTLPFLLLCIAALRALVAQARQLAAAQWVMLSYLAFASVNAVLFFGEHRHHLPGVPMLALCAGTAIAAQGRTPLTRTQRRVFLVLATLLVANLAYRAGVDIVTFHSMLESAGRWTP